MDKAFSLVGWLMAAMLVGLKWTPMGGTFKAAACSRTDLAARMGQRKPLQYQNLPMVEVPTLLSNQNLSWSWTGQFELARISGRVAGRFSGSPVRPFDLLAPFIAWRSSPSPATVIL